MLNDSLRQKIFNGTVFINLTRLCARETDYELFVACHAAGRQAHFLWRSLEIGTLGEVSH